MFAGSMAMVGSTAVCPLARGFRLPRLLWLGCAAPLAILLDTSTASALPSALAPHERASAPGMNYVSAVSLNAQVLDLTLSDAVYLGLRGNRGIRSAYLHRVSQKFDLKVAENALAPKLTLSSDYKAGRGSADRDRDFTLKPGGTLFAESGARVSLGWAHGFNQADRQGRKESNSLALEVVQPLLRGAGRDVVTAPRRLARLSEQSHRLSLKSTVAQTVSQIVAAYRELLMAQEGQRIAIDALQRSRHLLEMNDAMIVAGRMARFERVQTQAALARDELAVEEAANQLDMKRLDLLRLLALDLGTRLRASEALSAERVRIDRQHAVQVALQRQPDYLKQLIGAEEADINLRLAHDERLWDVSLVAGADQHRSMNASAEAGRSERRWGSFAGLRLEIPIGDLNARQRVVSAQVAVDAQALRQLEAREQLEQQVSGALRDMGTGWRQYEIARRGLELSQRQLEIERDKLQVGRSSNFQVLTYETSLRTAEHASLNALISYLNAQTRLDEYLGTTLDSWEIALND